MQFQQGLQRLHSEAASLHSAICKFDFGRGEPPEAYLGRFATLATQCNKLSDDINSIFQHYLVFPKAASPQTLTSIPDALRTKQIPELEQEQASCDLTSESGLSADQLKEKVKEYNNAIERALVNLEKISDYYRTL
eukprot:tig00020614_g12224.t1